MPLAAFPIAVGLGWSIPRWKQMIVGLLLLMNKDGLTRKIYLPLVMWRGNPDWLIRQHMKPEWLLKPFWGNPPLSCQGRFLPLFLQILKSLGVDLWKKRQKKKGPLLGFKISGGGFGGKPLHGDGNGLDQNDC